MKKIITGFLLLSALLLSAKPTTDNIIKALKAGNSKEIAKHFGESVDLSILDNEGVYSKTQAQLILQNFFLTHPPTHFSIMHQSDAKNNSFYAIGNLSTTENNFRTYILYKEVKKTIIILELKVEAEE